MDPTKILLMLSLIYLSEGQQEVVVRLEEDVTLQCMSPGGRGISVLKWSRPDLNTYGYVYFYRNKRSYHSYQHPSFHGRVRLRQADMKGGDASLILKNVTFNDAGIYECHISSGTMKRSRRDSSEISHFISLSVTADEGLLSEQESDVAGGDKGEDVNDDGGTGSRDVLLVAGGAAAAAVVVVAAVVFGALIVFRSFKKSKKQKPAEYQVV